MIRVSLVFPMGCLLLTHLVVNSLAFPIAGDFILPENSSNVSLIGEKLAFCFVGAVRTFVEQKIYRDLKNMVDVSLGDSFLVLYTGIETSAKGEDELFDWSSLASAIRILKPRGIKIQTVENYWNCGNPTTGQFVKWSKCVDLIKMSEFKQGIKYSFMLKTRPDLLWRHPVDIREVIHESNLLSNQSTVVTGNDVNILLHRSTWYSLTQLANVTCFETCDGRNPVWVRPFNEYCLMKTNFQKLGISHIETEGPFPDEEFIANHRLTQKIMAHSHTIHRSEYSKNLIRMRGMPAFDGKGAQEMGLRSNKKLYDRVTCDVDDIFQVSCFPCVPFVKDLEDKCKDKTFLL
mmetsp:Transcript_30851/g.42735  ORF Transcript_30851/g.42735 Transcript_30851/m.42735 type:complete len:347 (+) Transcript_30851:75-1115(+)